jgi:TonB-dependent starch-binding outer membrane protein SusC
MQTIMIRIMGIVLAAMLLVPALIAQQTNMVPDFDSRTLAFQNQMPDKDSEAYAQLQMVIELNLEEASLEEALNVISEQADLKLMYRKALLPEDKKVTYNNNSMTVYDALWDLLDGTGLRFAISQNQQLVILSMGEEVEVEEAFQETVSGQVTDAQTGEAIPGANVVLLNTEIGTATNVNGEFTLNVPDLTGTLLITYIGYERQEVPVDGRTEINVILHQDIVLGEDLVVIGYGVVAREEITSSVSRVNSEDFVQGTALDAAEIIRGRVPGLSVNKTGSNPTETSQLMLRGTGTLIGDASPLIIIDGVEGSLSDVATRDIENIHVIKDGSAAAIYGTRGSNGVIIIETTRARRDVVIVNYDSYVSTQHVANKIPVFSADEYRNIDIDGLDIIDFGHSNDWQDLVYRDMPISHEHNLNVSAGTGDTRYIATLNYKNFEGIVNRSDNNIINGRLRVDHSALDGSLNLSGTVNLSNKWHFQGSQGGSFNNRVVNNITAFNPTRPIFNEDGSYNDSGDNNHENPVSIIEEVNGEFQETRANFHGTIDYSPIRDLNVRVQGSRFTTDDLTGYAQTKDHVIDLRNGTNGYASRAANKQVQNTIDVTAEYRGMYRSHNYNLLGGYSWQETNQEGFFANNWDFPSDAVAYNNLGDGTAQSRGQTTSSSYKQRSNLIGYFSRINYNYNNRYLLMASIRIEGSSKFGSENQWGRFPALSAGWNISNESFMNDVDLVDELKLRFGYGRTGTAPSDPYLSLSRVAFGARFFSNGSWVPTIQPLNNPNPNLRWETRDELNLGVDFSILENRIDGSVDVYRRETKDLLFNFNVPTPPFLFNRILANAGTIENRGIEVNLNFRPVQRENLQWRSTVNYSTNANELTSLSSEDFTIGEGGFFDAGATGAPIQQQTHRVQVGEAIGNFYAFKTIGVTDDGMWLIEGQDGQPKSIADQVPEDKHFVGNGVPDHELSWSNTINYRNWDFSVLMRGAFGFQVANMRGMFFGVPQVLRQMNALTSSIEVKYGDRPLSPDQPEQYVSHFIEDGDFWKIDNITIGHNFSIGDSGIFRDARVYLTGNNLITITGYSGYDPDINFSGLTPGIDHIFRFPPARSYTLGVSLTF